MDQYQEGGHRIGRSLNRIPAMNMGTSSKFIKMCVVLCEEYISKVKQHVTVFVEQTHPFATVAGVFLVTLKNPFMFPLQRRKKLRSQTFLINRTSTNHNLYLTSIEHLHRLAS